MVRKNAPLSPPSQANPLRPLYAFLDLCSSYLWLILSVTFLSIGVAGLWAISAPPIYQASATVTFEFPKTSSKEHFNHNEQDWKFQTTRLKTHIQRLKSDLHLEKVAHQIILIDPPGYQSWLSREKRVFPFLGVWSQPVDDRIQNLQKFMEQWLPQPILSEDQSSSKDTTSTLNVSSPTLRLVTWLKKYIQIETITYQPAVRITTKAQNPNFAAVVANTVGTLYIDTIHTSTLGPSLTLTSMTNQLVRIKKKLRQTKETLENYKSQNPHLSLEGDENQDQKSLSTLDQLKVKLSQTTKQLKKYQIQLTLLKKIQKAFVLNDSEKKQWVALPSLQRFSSPLNMSKVEEIYAERNKWNSKIQSWLQESNVDLRKIQSAQQQLANLHLLFQKEVGRGIQVASTQLANTTVQEKQTRQHIKRLKNSLDQPKKKLTKYNQLVKAVKYLKALHTSQLELLKNHHEPKHQSFERAKLSYPANPPQEPLSEQPIQTLSWGLLVGIIAGITLAIPLDWNSRKKRYIHTPTDLKRINPELHFLGWMPDTDSTGKGTLSPFLNAENSLDSIAVQAIQSMTKNLPYDRTDNDLDLWLITSPAQRDGKTLLAQYLAKVQVEQLSKQVLLIDANITQPTVHYMVPFQNKHKPSEGLSDFLLEKAEIENIVQDTPIPGLSMISTGNYSTLPHEVFQSSKFSQLLQWCKAAQFHVIIIGPPISDNVETRLIASQVDQTMIIVRPETTSRKELKSATQYLESYGANISGIVFFQTPSKNMLLKMKKVESKPSSYTRRSRWKKNDTSQTKRHEQISQRTRTQQKPKDKKRKTHEPTLLDCQRENYKLKAQLQRLKNEREVLVNSARYFAKFAKSPQEIMIQK